MNLPVTTWCSAIVAWYEQLSPQTLPQLHQLYAPDAWFQDPFNRIQGTAEIEALFQRMFHTLQQPRFVVQERIEQADKAFLVWDFTFLWQGKAMHIHGGTLLHFAPDGRVVNHRDYWDAAGELYEKIPLLGALLRRIKRHMA